MHKTYTVENGHEVYLNDSSGRTFIHYCSSVETANELVDRLSRPCGSAEGDQRVSVAVVEEAYPVLPSMEQRGKLNRVIWLRAAMKAAERTLDEDTVVAFADTVVRSFDQRVMDSFFPDPNADDSDGATDGGDAGA